jgi:hypothetical protein
MRLTSSSPYQRVDIRGDEIWINERQARVIEEIRRQVNQEVKPGESLLIVPHSPGLYVILDRKSPIREGFLYMEVTEKRQRRAIGGIESQKVEWVLLGDKRFDDMEERDMESAHPLLWNYLRQNYCPLGDGGTASGRKLRRRCRPWPNGPTGGGR